jgi:hypothetical protein
VELQEVLPSKRTVFWANMIYDVPKGIDASETKTPEKIKHVEDMVEALLPVGITVNEHSVRTDGEIKIAGFCVSCDKEIIHVGDATKTAMSISVPPVNIRGDLLMLDPRASVGPIMADSLSIGIESNQPTGPKDKYGIIFTFQTSGPIIKSFVELNDGNTEAWLIGKFPEAYRSEVTEVLNQMLAGEHFEQFRKTFIKDKASYEKHYDTEKDIEQDITNRSTTNSAWHDRELEFDKRIPTIKDSRLKDLKVYKQLLRVPIDEMKRENQEAFQKLIKEAPHVQKQKMKA